MYRPSGFVTVTMQVIDICFRSRAPCDIGRISSLDTFCKLFKAQIYERKSNRYIPVTFKLFKSTVELYFIAIILYK